MRWPVALLLCAITPAPALGQTFGDWFRHGPDRWGGYPDRRLDRGGYPDRRLDERYYGRERPHRYWLDDPHRRWLDSGTRARPPHWLQVNPDPRFGTSLLDGGPRPRLMPVLPAQVDFASTFAPGTIVIDSGHRRLYLVISSYSALVYPISVGREGFAWTGVQHVSRIAEWPDWYPPAEMRQRDPRLPEKMSGGLHNPLGAKALYLGNTLYRIHGTDDERSIGYAISSGCIRMTNGHVIDLANRVGVGTMVVVVDRLPAGVARSIY